MTGIMMARRRNDQYSADQKRFFADQLRSAMSTAGIKTNIELAKKISVEGMTVGRWVNAEAIPEIENIGKLCKALGVTYEFLRGESTVPIGQACLVWSDDHHAETIKKTIKVLRSNSYSDPLQRNIDSFHRAIEKEAEMDLVKKKLEDMEKKMEKLQAQLNFTILTPKKKNVAMSPDKI